MISEALINEEYDRLGITVTPDELTEAMIGENAIRRWHSGPHRQAPPPVSSTT